MSKINKITKTLVNKLKIGDKVKVEGEWGLFNGWHDNGETVYITNLYNGSCSGSYLWQEIQNIKFARYDKKII